MAAERHRPVLETDLFALADGRLSDDPLRRARVEEAIRRDPSLATRAEAYRAQSKALHDHYDRRLAEPVPPHLMEALDGRPASRRSLQRTLAFLVVALAAGSAGWLGGIFSTQDGDTPAALLESSYTRFVQTKIESRNAQASPTANPATSLQPGPSWNSDELTLSFPAPDLSSHGYSLVARNLFETGTTQTVHLEYAAPDGSRFSLFLRPRESSQFGGMEFARRGDVSMAYWFDGPLASAIATRLPAAQAQSLAHAVQGALHTPAFQAHRAPGQSPQGGSPEARGILMAPDQGMNSAGTPAARSAPGFVRPN